MTTLLMAWALALGPSPEPASPEPRAPTNAPSPTDDEPLEIHPPRLIEPITTTRPSSENDEEVEVLMSLQIDVDGRVTRAEVVESGGTAFDHAALEVARRFRFEPAREGQTPIAVEIRYRYVFPPPKPEPEPDPDPPEPEASQLTVIDDVEVVMAPRIEDDAARIELDAERGQLYPGTQGDALKATQALAGVARPPAGTGELVLWGASASASRRTIDGIPVPRLFHLGGSRSVLPSPLLESVELIPGGFGSSRGRAIGGYVQAHTRPARSGIDPRRVGGHARVDPIDAGASVDARLSERGWLMLAARRSLLAQTYGSLAPASTQQLVPLPNYWDYQAKSIVQISKRDELTLLGFGAHDRVERGIPSLTPDTAFTERRTSAFNRVGLRYRRQHDDGRSVTAQVWAGRDDDRWAQRFVPEHAISNHRAWRGGLRLEERRRLARVVTLRWGLDTELGHHTMERVGAITLPAREGDAIVFGQPPGDRVARDAWITTQVGLAGYSSLLFEFAEGRWAMEPGLRIEPLITVGDRILPVRPIEPEIGHTDIAVALDPRLQLRWSPLPELSLFAAGGRYHQAADPSDLSPVFGNPRLGHSQAYHAVLGTHTSPLSWLDLDLTGFWIRSLDLTARNDQATPPVATLLLSEGQGRSYGGQLGARAHPTAGLLFGVTYTLMRAERRDPGAEAWRPFDFDQPHGLHALAGWTHRSGVELGGRVSLGSGYPRTPVVGAVANGRTGGYDPILGEPNTGRLPLSLSLSLRAGFRRAWPWGELRTWIDLLNATNHRNVEEIFYSSDFSAQGAVTGLPVLPSVGLEIRR